MAGCFLVKIPVYHMVGIRSTLFGLANIIKNIHMHDMSAPE